MSGLNRESEEVLFLVVDGIEYYRPLRGSSRPPIFEFKYDDPPPYIVIRAEEYALACKAESDD